MSRLRGTSRVAPCSSMSEPRSRFHGRDPDGCAGSFRGYANAIRDELPEAITVLDAFHVVKLGSAIVDEVHRRVQQDTLGHRGRKGDPLYGIRRTLQIGAERIADKQAARLEAMLTAGDPGHEVTIVWHCYQKLRSIHHARPEKDGNS
jgi:transposase